jgi:sterol desaturase/sphingolipid hydroxylase (fatty acid hydroxylase superfamily)
MELPWIALALLAVIALERTRLRRLPARFLRPHFAADLAFFLTGAVALGIAMRGVAERAAVALGVPALPAWPPLATFALTLVLYDLGAWLAHRAMHRFEFLWRAHKIHHASPQLDWLAAFRLHPIEYAVRHALSPVMLLLAGFPVAHVAAASAVSAGWAAFVHANLQLGSHWLEALVITPRVHHLHHAPATSERNFGAVLSVWDRVAGRLVRASARRDAQLGVPGEELTHPHGFWAQLREPFRAAPGGEVSATRSRLSPPQAAP